MEWFRKDKTGITPQERRAIPEGLWTKCQSCGEIIYTKKMESLLWVCPNCNFHFRISSRKYINLLLDGGRLEEFDNNLQSADPLSFRDSKKYPDRLRDARNKSESVEGVICGIGGSMGSVVGEKIARSIERAINGPMPLVIVSCSGGARMQEGILSLMQMAKTSALLATLAQKKQPYVSILTNPTTAGVMASYASLGDIIIAEPKALLGFAGARVIQQTIGQELPEGFQSTEFFLDKGFVDKIVERKDLRDTTVKMLRYLGAS